MSNDSASDAGAVHGRQDAMQVGSCVPAEVICVHQESGEGTPP